MAPPPPPSKRRLADVARLPASAFPQYDRNLNTGGPLATGTEMIVATNSICIPRNIHHT